MDLKEAFQLQVTQFQEDNIVARTTMKLQMGVAPDAPVRDWNFKFQAKNVSYSKIHMKIQFNFRKEERTGLSIEWKCCATRKSNINRTLLLQFVILSQESLWITWKNRTSLNGIPLLIL